MPSFVVASQFPKRADPQLIGQAHPGLPEEIEVFLGATVRMHRGKSESMEGQQFAEHPGNTDTEPASTLSAFQVIDDYAGSFAKRQCDSFGLS